MFDRTTADATTTTDHDRRAWVRAGLGLGAALVIPGTGLAKAPAITGTATRRHEKRLSFLNLHTGERLTTTFWADGKFDLQALSDIDRVLRDHRTGDVEPMDHKLLLALTDLRARLDTDATIHVISGYRSPKTNAMLRKVSGGVAKKSYHMKGQAIDLRLPNLPLKTVRKAAKALNKGGVGYYPGSDFIHMDTGPVRYW